MLKNRFYRVSIFLIIINLSSCKYTNIYIRKNQNKSLSKNYYEQSKIETNKQKFKNALVLINKAIKEYPAPEYLALKATLLYETRNFEESIMLFKKVITDKATPATLKANCLNNYACTLNQLGYQKKAEQIWKKLTKNYNYITPEVAYFNLGLLKIFNHELEKAKENLLNAIEIEKNYVDAIFYLGITLKKMNKKKSAIAVLKKLLEIAPEHKAAENLIRLMS